MSFPFSLFLVLEGMLHFEQNRKVICLRQQIFEFLKLQHLEILNFILVKKIKSNINRGP